MVKQNIVFVENTPGSLQKVTKILAENQIDIYGFGCFDAPEFANFRMVCDDPEKADQIMAENGYMTRITLRPSWWIFRMRSAAWTNF